MNAFAQRILEQKYSKIKANGEKESWDEIAHRVTYHVLKAVDMPKSLKTEIKNIIQEGKFYPGGRYLYSAGRQYHQTQNCLLLRAEDSRAGWADLMQKATLSLMTGAGIGIDYSDIRAKGKSIRKTGGTATGPLALCQMVNEAGRGIMQGGSRRSAIWAGLSWKHPDIHEFIRIKNWIPEVRDLKNKDFNFPATMDGTNVSVQLDDEFFEAYHDDKHQHHSLAFGVYWATIRQMLKTAEPGFSVDVGKNKGETLRNAPVSANTYVFTNKGYCKVGDIVNTLVTVWTGKRWAETTFKKTGESVDVVRVTMSGGRKIVCDPSHEFITEDEHRVKAANLLEDTSLLISLPYELPEETPDRLYTDYYTLGYTYGDGSFVSRRNAEITLCTEESKRCFEGLSASLMSSVKRKDSRGYTRVYLKASEFWANRYKAVFPEEMYQKSLVSKAAFLAGLFDSDGNYFEAQNRVRLASKHVDFLEGCRRLLESLGILSGISTAGISTFGGNQGYMLTVNTQYVTRFARVIPTIRVKPKSYEAYRDTKIRVISVEPAGVEDVYCCDVGFEEHAFMAEGVIIANCTEITSRDDSDICNLGSINLARISSVSDMARTVELGTAFLVAGTVYSDVPYAAVDHIRTKNRRLGLGLMGIHEWLLKQGEKYGWTKELDSYLFEYSKSGAYAKTYADKWDLSTPVKTRAIAPTGTISIIAGTSSGIEPLFCAAYKRRYLKGSTWAYEYVLDPTAKRLVDNGIAPEAIEDAYSLAQDIERRVEFQAHVQHYVDHAISSTINLPAWGSELNNDSTVQVFGELLIKYLPKLRGLTVYPDGCRGGQPLSTVSWEAASQYTGQVFEEAGDVCDLTHSGTCGG